MTYEEILTAGARTLLAEWDLHEPTPVQAAYALNLVRVITETTTPKLAELWGSEISDTLAKVRGLVSRLEDLSADNLRLADVALSGERAMSALTPS